MTLGRLPKCLDIARALAAAGCDVQIAEPHQRHLAGASRSVRKNHRLPAPAEDRAAYESALLALIERERIELLVPVSEESLFIAALRPRLPENLSVYAAQPDTVLALHDKAAFAQRCERLQRPVPQTALASDSAALDLLARGPTISKPRYSCAGAGLLQHEKGAELTATQRIGERVVQQAIEGPLLASFTLAHEGRVLLTVLYRARVLSGSVAVCFEQISSATRPEQAWATGWHAEHDLPKICASAHASIEALVADSRYSGFIAFDFLVNAQQEAVAIECNPRATSGIHFVTPEALAAAILHPGRAPVAPRRSQSRLQQFYPTLTETQNALWARPGHRVRGLARSHLGNLLRARDVTFRWRDPLPFALMPYWAWPIMAPALFAGRSFGEVATQDIDWAPTT